MSILLSSFCAVLYIVYIIYLNWHVFPSQGFQSGPVPGTFTRLRSCITEPSKISGGQNHKYDGR